MSRGTDTKPDRQAGTDAATPVRSKFATSTPRRDVPFGKLSPTTWFNTPSAIKWPVVALFSLLMLVSLASSVFAKQNLPGLGEPADASLSPAAELKLGKRFMRQIRAQVPLIEDIQVVEYIEALGSRLAVNIDNPENHEFTFFVVNSASINAFAIPGGFIGFNSGLIDAMNNEDQLAAVVGHEIAHITQRHHARSISSGTRSRLTTAFAVLAAVLIGQSNPQAGQAALAAGIAASQQSLINFTRANEYEADRVGIEILAAASYNPAAMAEAFEILKRKNSLNVGSFQLEYLRTHPLDNTRIAEAKNRATALQGKELINTSLDFAIFQARTRVLTSRDLNHLGREYLAKADSQRATERAAANYALAMILTERRLFTEAIERLDSLLESYPDNINIQLLAARTWFESGDTERGIERLQLLSSIFPDNYSVTNMLVAQFIDSNRLNEAQSLLKRYLKSSQRTNNFAWRDLANVEENLGDSSASHEALARYFTGLNELSRARQQLTLALSVVNRGSVDELRINARIRELDTRLEREK